MRHTKKVREWHTPEWQEVFGTLVEDPYDDVPEDLFESHNNPLKEVVR